MVLSKYTYVHVHGNSVMLCICQSFNWLALINNMHTQMPAGPKVKNKTKQTTTNMTWQYDTIFNDLHQLNKKNHNR